jgi:hypothetical protein
MHDPDTGWFRYNPPEQEVQFVLAPVQLAQFTEELQIMQVYPLEKVPEGQVE